MRVGGGAGHTSQQGWERGGRTHLPAGVGEGREDTPPSRGGRGEGEDTPPSRGGTGLTPPNRGGGEGQDTHLPTGVGGGEGGGEGQDTPPSRGEGGGGGGTGGQCMYQAVGGIATVWLPW